jgi:hypothetical protein
LLRFRVIIGTRPIRRTLRVGPSLETICPAVSERNAHVEAIGFICFGVNTWEIIFDIQGGILLPIKMETSSEKEAFQYKSANPIIPERHFAGRVWFRAIFGLDT